MGSSSPSRDEALQGRQEEASGDSPDPCSTRILRFVSIDPHHSRLTLKLESERQYKRRIRLWNIDKNNKVYNDH